MSKQTQEGKLDSVPVGKKAGKVKNKGGRPTVFSKELAWGICERVVEGESLRTILKSDDMPGMSTLFRWLDENEWFREQYAWSKNNQADTNAEDLQDISKKVLAGEYDPAAARVAADILKWSSAKLKPKKYGDKIDMTTNGKDLPAPILGGLTSTEDKLTD